MLQNKYHFRTNTAIALKASKSNILAFGQQPIKSNQKTKRKTQQGTIQNQGSTLSFALLPMLEAIAIIDSLISSDRGSATKGGVSQAPPPATFGHHAAASQTAIAMRPAVSGCDSRAKKGGEGRGGGIVILSEKAANSGVVIVNSTISSPAVSPSRFGKSFALDTNTSKTSANLSSATQHLSPLKVSKRSVLDISDAKASVPPHPSAVDVRIKKPSASNARGTYSKVSSSPKAALSSSSSSLPPLSLLPIHTLQWNTFVNHTERLTLSAAEAAEAEGRAELMRAAEEDATFLRKTNTFLKRLYNQHVALYEALCEAQREDRCVLERLEANRRRPISHAFCAACFGQQYLTQILRRGAILEDDLQRERKFTFREEAEARRALIVSFIQGQWAVMQRSAANIQRRNRRAQDFIRVAKQYTAYFPPEIVAAILGEGGEDEHLLNRPPSFEFGGGFNGDAIDEGGNGGGGGDFGEFSFCPRSEDGGSYVGSGHHGGSPSSDDDDADADDDHLPRRVPPSSYGSATVSHDVAAAAPRREKVTFGGTDKIRNPSSVAHSSFSRQDGTLNSNETKTKKVSRPSQSFLSKHVVPAKLKKDMATMDHIVAKLTSDPAKYTQASVETARTISCNGKLSKRARGLMALRDPSSAGASSRGGGGCAFKEGGESVIPKEWDGSTYHEPAVSVNAVSYSSAFTATPDGCRLTLYDPSPNGGGGGGGGGATSTAPPQQWSVHVNFATADQLSGKADVTGSANDAVRDDGSTSTALRPYCHIVGVSSSTSTSQNKAKKTEGEEGSGSENNQKTKTVRAEESPLLIPFASGPALDAFLAAAQLMLTTSGEGLKGIIQREEEGGEEAKQIGKKAPREDSCQQSFPQFLLRHHLSAVASKTLRGLELEVSEEERERRRRRRSSSRRRSSYNTASSYSQNSHNNTTNTNNNKSSKHENKSPARATQKSPPPHHTPSMSQSASRSASPNQKALEAPHLSSLPSSPPPYCVAFKRNVSAALAAIGSATDCGIGGGGGDSASSLYSTPPPPCLQLGLSVKGMLADELDRCLGEACTHEDSSMNNGVRSSQAPRGDGSRRISSTSSSNQQRVGGDDDHSEDLNVEGQQKEGRRGSSSPPPPTVLLSPIELVLLCSKRMLERVHEGEVDEAMVMLMAAGLEAFNTDEATEEAVEAEREMWTSMLHKCRVFSATTSAAEGILNSLLRCPSSLIATATPAVDTSINTNNNSTTDPSQNKPPKPAPLPSSEVIYGALTLLATVVEGARAGLSAVQSEIDAIQREAEEASERRRQRQEGEEDDDDVDPMAAGEDGEGDEDEVLRPRSLSELAERESPEWAAENRRRRQKQQHRKLQVSQQQRASSSMPPRPRLQQKQGGGGGETDASRRTSRNSSGGRGGGRGRSVFFSPRLVASLTAYGLHFITAIQNLSEMIAWVGLHCPVPPPSPVGSSSGVALDGAAFDGDFSSSSARMRSHSPLSNTSSQQQPARARTNAGHACPLSPTVIAAPTAFDFLGPSTFQRTAYFPLVAFHWSLAAHRLFQCLIHAVMAVELGVVATPIDIAFKEEYPTRTQLLSSKRVRHYFARLAEARRLEKAHHREEKAHQKMNAALIERKDELKQQQQQKALTHHNNTASHRLLLSNSGADGGGHGNTIAVTSADEEGNVRPSSPPIDYAATASAPPPPFHARLLKCIEDQIVLTSGTVFSTRAVSVGPYTAATTTASSTTTSGSDAADPTGQIMKKGEGGNPAASSSNNTKGDKKKTFDDARLFGDAIGQLTKKKSGSFNDGSAFGAGADEGGGGGGGEGFGTSSFRPSSASSPPKRSKSVFFPSADELEAHAAAVLARPRRILLSTPTYATAADVLRTLSAHSLHSQPTVGGGGDSIGGGLLVPTAATTNPAAVMLVVATFLWEGGSLTQLSKASGNNTNTGPFNALAGSSIHRGKGASLSVSNRFSASISRSPPPPTKATQGGGVGAAASSNRRLLDENEHSFSIGRGAATNGRKGMLGAAEVESDDGEGEASTRDDQMAAFASRPARANSRNGRDSASEERALVAAPPPPPSIRFLLAGFDGSGFGVRRPTSPSPLSSPAELSRGHTAATQTSVSVGGGVRGGGRRGVSQHGGASVSSSRVAHRPIMTVAFLHHQSTQTDAPRDVLVANDAEHAVTA